MVVTLGYNKVNKGVCWKKKRGPLNFAPELTPLLKRHPSRVPTVPWHSDLASFNAPLSKPWGWGASFHQPWFCFTSGSPALHTGYFFKSKEVMEQVKTPRIKCHLWDSETHCDLNYFSHKDKCKNLILQDCSWATWHKSTAPGLCITVSAS